MNSERLVPHGLRGGLIGTDNLPVYVLAEAGVGSGIYFEQRGFLTHLLYQDAVTYRKREKAEDYLGTLQDRWSLVGTAFDYGNVADSRVRTCILRSDM